MEEEDDVSFKEMGVMVPVRLSNQAKPKRRESFSAPVTRKDSRRRFTSVGPGEVEAFGEYVLAPEVTMTGADTQARLRREGKVNI